MTVLSLERGRNLKNEEINVRTKLVPKPPSGPMHVSVDDMSKENFMDRFDERVFIAKAKSSYRAFDLGFIVQA